MMDRKEAIEKLNALAWVQGGPDREEMIEAVSMAIKSLSAKPTDLISREDAIKAIESRQTEQWIDADVDYNNGLESAVVEIKALPSADRPIVDKEYLIDLIQEAVYDGEACSKLMDLVDRPSREWIKATGMMPPEFHGHHCCSKCGSFANMEPPFGNREDLSKFCPNCGAKMGSD